MKVFCTTEVHWLPHGKVLKSFVKLKEEYTLSFHRKTSKCS